MEISNTTVYALTEAGWFEGRNIDINPAVELLKGKGYQITPAFIEFYSEFGGLMFSLQVDGHHRRFGFDLEITFAFLQEDNEAIIEVYPKAVGCETLTLVGIIGGSDTLAIAVNEAGILYKLYAGSISEIGIGIDAINKLINQSWSQFETIYLANWY